MLRALDLMAGKIIVQLGIAPPTAVRNELRALAADPSAAHDLVPGVTGFPAALLHPLFLFDQLIVLVVAGLLAGQMGQDRLLPGLAALIAGIAAGYAIPFYEILPAIAAAMMTLIAAGIGGGIVAAAPALPLAAALCLLAAIGVTIGGNTFAEVPVPLAMAEALGGAAITSGLVVAVLGAGVARLKWPWAKVGVRIAGSWIAAASIMVVAYIVSRWSDWG